MAEKEMKKLKGKSNKFIKIKCSDCGNEQITFTRASSVVVCHICGAEIARPTGGLIKTSGEIVEEY